MSDVQYPLMVWGEMPAAKASSATSNMSDVQHPLLVWGEMPAAKASSATSNMSDVQHPLLVWGEMPVATMLSEVDMPMELNAIPYDCEIWRLGWDKHVDELVDEMLEHRFTGLAQLNFVMGGVQRRHDAAMDDAQRRHDAAMDGVLTRNKNLKKKLLLSAQIGRAQPVLVAPKRTADAALLASPQSKRTKRGSKYEPVDMDEISSETGYMPPPFWQASIPFDGPGTTEA